MKINGIPKKIVTNCLIRLERLLDKTLSVQQSKHASKLTQAMRYVVLGGGKRFRSLLVYVVGSIYDVGLEKLDSAAIALEMIHSFSLVHDDLPAMDNDSLRRGKATCHLAYDEATAVLVGDALLTLAFETLSGDHNLTDQQKVKMIKILAQASGLLGMASGQYLDLHPASKPNKKQIIALYQLKTGELISAALQLAAVAAGHDQDARLGVLRKLGLTIGVAFQIRDDLDNIEGDSKKLGKNVKTDQMMNKPTYPEIVGVKKAKDDLIKLGKTIDRLLQQSKLEHSLSSYLIKAVIRI